MLQKTSEKKQDLIKISGSTTLLCTIVDVLRCLRPGSLSAGLRSARWSGVGTSTASPSSGPGLSPSSALVYKLFFISYPFSISRYSYYDYKSNYKTGNPRYQNVM